MRKIYSQSITKCQSQLALSNLAKGLGVPESRVLESILESIDTSDLTALATGRRSTSEKSNTQLDIQTIEAIRDEIAQGFSLLSERVLSAAHAGGREGVLDLCSSALSGEQR